MKLNIFSMFACLLLFLPQCGGLRISSKINKKEQSKNAWAEYEAKLYDIPILINAQFPRYESDSDKNILSVSYTLPRAIIDAKTCYEQEMDRLGWQLVVSFHSQESLYIFEKPSKFCSISIRPHTHDQVKIAIFLKVKESACSIID